MVLKLYINNLTKVGCFNGDSQREQRKNEHVEIAMSQKDAVSDFDKVRFVHHSIPVLMLVRSI